MTICSNMDGLGGIMVSEISQTEKQILYDIMYMWNLKTSEYNEKKQTHREETSGYPWGGAI